MVREVKKVWAVYGGDEQKNLTASYLSNRSNLGWNF